MDALRWWTASIPHFPIPPGTQPHLPPKGLRTSSHKAKLLKHPLPVMQLQVSIEESRETSAGLEMHIGTMPVSWFLGFSYCPFSWRLPGDRGSPACSCTWAKAYAVSLSSSCLFWAHTLLSLRLTTSSMIKKLNWYFNTQIMDRELPYYSHRIPSISLNPIYKSCLKTLRSSHQYFWGFLHHLFGI